MLATEQNVKIKFCVLLYKSLAQTLKMLEEADGKVERTQKGTCHQSFSLPVLKILRGLKPVTECFLTGNGSIIQEIGYTRFQTTKT
jgi:hypothetical protein